MYSAYMYIFFLNIAKQLPLLLGCSYHCPLFYHLLFTTIPIFPGCAASMSESPAKILFGLFLNSHTIIALLVGISLI